MKGRDIVNWLKLHPVVLAAGAGFAAGAILPRFVGWVLT